MVGLKNSQIHSTLTENGEPQRCSFVVFAFSQKKWQLCLKGCFLIWIMSKVWLLVKSNIVQVSLITPKILCYVELCMFSFNLKSFFIEWQIQLFAHFTGKIEMFSSVLVLSADKNFDALTEKKITWFYKVIWFTTSGYNSIFIIIWKVLFQCEKILICLRQIILIIISSHFHCHLFWKKTSTDWTLWFVSKEWS